MGNCDKTVFFLRKKAALGVSLDTAIPTNHCRSLSLFFSLYLCCPPARYPRQGTTLHKQRISSVLHYCGVFLRSQACATRTRRWLLHEIWLMRRDTYRCDDQAYCGAPRNSGLQHEVKSDQQKCLGPRGWMKTLVHLDELKMQGTLSQAWENKTCLWAGQLFLNFNWQEQQTFD